VSADEAAGSGEPSTRAVDTAATADTTADSTADTTADTTTTTTAGSAADNNTNGARVLEGPRRVHPLTPFVKGWGYFVGTAIVMAQNEGLRSEMQFAVLALLGVFAAGVVLGGLSWWYTKYQLTEDALRVDAGFLFRRTRIMRFDRLQAIDVAQPFVARLFGLAELRMDVAGGSGSDGRLSYLMLADARRLRATLIATASRLEKESLHPDTMEAPQRDLIRVPTSRLLGATMLSSTVIASLGGLITLVSATMLSDRHIGLFAVLPLAFGVFQPIWKQVIGNHGFTVSESPDGLRTKRGLLDLQRQTVPPGRVQGLVISEPIVWRLLGWGKVDLDIAGVAGSNDLDEMANGAQLLPVGDRGEISALLHRVLPGLELDRVELHGAPARAKWLRPVGWRYLAYGVDEQVLVTTRGWVNRRTSVVLHHKTQSVRLAQGPLQRALRLAHVHVDTPVGPADAVALHRDQAEAAVLLWEQADRARQARRADDGTA
jgi:putative membrane protein